MERVSIITHKNVKIVFFDGKGTKEDENCEGIIKLTDMAIENKIHFHILDITGTHTTPKVAEVADRERKRAVSQLGEVFVSIIGLSKIQQVISNRINLKQQYFASDMEDAKEWIVSKTL